MAHDVLLALHFWLSVLMGALGLTSMLLKKGAPRHRLAGTLFVACCSVQVVTGVALMLMAPKGLLQGWVALPFVYLTLTGWATARRWGDLGKPLTFAGAMLGAFAIAAALPLIWREHSSPSGGPGGVAFMGVLTALVLWFTLLDLKVIRAGGSTGTGRTIRHVWRMGLAVSLITASTLTAIARAHPTLMGFPLFVPAMLALGLTMVWLVRLRFAPVGPRRRLPVWQRM